MKVSFNRSDLTFKFQIDEDHFEEDLFLGTRIEKMMESEEWKILAGEWFKAREQILDSLKKVKPTELSARECLVKSSAFNGFDEAVDMASKIVKAGKDFRNKRIKELDDEIRTHAESNGYSPD